MHPYSFDDHKMNRDALFSRVKKEATGQDMFVHTNVPPEGSRFVKSHAFKYIYKMGDLNGRTRQISENLSDALLNTTMVKTYRMM